MIARIELTNWARFKGQHVVELKSGAYAIQAQRTEDAGRSNWTGKTKFMEAVPFALHGWHDYRTDEEWISRGESSGQVLLAFGDGTVVARGREDGSNWLSFTSATGKTTRSNQTTKVQGLVNDWLGLSQDDFFLVSFIQQTAAAAFAKLKPAQFVAFTERLFNMGPLAEAAQRASKEVTRIRKDFDRLQIELAQEERIGAGHRLRMAKLFNMEDDVDNLQALIKRAHEVRNEARDRRTAGQNLILQSREYEIWRREAERHAQYKEKLARLERREVAKPNRRQIDIATNRLDAANEVLAGKRSEERAAVLLVSKGFCGTCPVTDKTCPIADEINEEAGRFKTRAAEAKEAASSALATRTDAMTKASELTQAAQTYEIHVADLKRVAQELAELPALSPAPPNPSHENLTELGQLEETESEMNLAIASLQRLLMARTNVPVELNERRTELRLWSLQAFVVGKHGAQRLYAQSRIDEVTEEANGALTDAGIELSMSVRWLRELQDLEPACVACGVAFDEPIRICPACSAPRPNRTKVEPQIETSDRSGGAMDLAGVTFQMAAAAQLRSRITTPWSTLIVDEPFGQLDATNSANFAIGFAKMALGRFGFEQAFVVAHDARINASLPNKIEIVGDENWSWFR